MHPFDALLDPAERKFFDDFLNNLAPPPINNLPFGGMFPTQPQFNLSIAPAINNSLNSIDLNQHRFQNNFHNNLHRIGGGAILPPAVQIENFLQPPLSTAPSLSASSSPLPSSTSVSPPLQHQPKQIPFSASQASAQTIERSFAAAQQPAAQQLQQTAAPVTAPAAESQPPQKRPRPQPEPQTEPTQPKQTEQQPAASAQQQAPASRKRSTRPRRSLSNHASQSKQPNQTSPADPSSPSNQHSTKSEPDAQPPPAHRTQPTHESQASKKRQIKRELLTEDEKRQNHVISEQKRRNLIRVGFQSLVDLTPSLANNPPAPSGPGNTGGSHSKSAVLFKAADYIRELRMQVQALTGQLKSAHASLGYPPALIDEILQAASAAAAAESVDETTAANIIASSSNQPLRNASATADDD